MVAELKNNTKRTFKIWNGKYDMGPNDILQVTDYNIEDLMLRIYRELDIMGEANLEIVKSKTLWYAAEIIAKPRWRKL